MKADILREKFLEFFRSKKHKVVESDSLAPKDDPTVLFTPAGMNQFKKQFMGYITDFTRAASSQRCLRTDDLDKVGKTDCHHTMFEMLGNFSFGDYFKDEAIAWAWEFLTQELKIDPQRLWVSVYKDDQEAYVIWKDKIKVPAERIVKLGDKDNFWPSDAKDKGPNGPCGPCSEIFLDLGGETGCRKADCSPACSCGRFIEIWNLVFTQFNRKEGGVLEPLPQKNIDTGMGLERLSAVMQGVKNNFDTDLFQPVIQEIKSAAGKPPKAEDLCAIADHLRAIVFSIYDGILPSNESRGYVVRKLIRKSILHLRGMGINEPFLNKLVPVLAEVMKKPYPELAKRRENIAEMILAEENNFIQTLNSSDNLLEEKLGVFSENQDPDKAGSIAFTLYDTYGIPLELTKDWLNKKGIKYSQSAFNKGLEEQKNRSKASSQMQGDVFDVKELKLDVRETEFLGYTELSNSAKILKIFKGTHEVKEIAQGQEATIILDKSVFYGESGGQVGDSGELTGGNNIFKVIDTQKSGKFILHKGKVEKGVFKENDPVTANLFIERRLSIARNHTVTHLLQAALRKVLGEHVHQQGSLVDVERLRFDFTHFKDIKKEELDRIEELVNEYIVADHPVHKKEMPLAQAKEQGALAFFADKYEDSVRVVSVDSISKEFCGGTHVDATGQIGVFKITSESSVASGVRRIEAQSGLSAYSYLKEREDVLEAVSSLLNVAVKKVPQEVQKKIQEIKALEKQLNSQKLNSVQSSIEKYIQDGQLINGKKVITAVVENADRDLLRKTVDLIKQKSQNSVILLGSVIDGKVALIMGLTPDLVKKGMDAKKLIQPVAAVLGGSGGGRPDLAQAGGEDPDNIPKAFAELKNIIESAK